VTPGAPSKISVAPCLDWQGADLLLISLAALPNASYVEQPRPTHHSLPGPSYPTDEEHEGTQGGARGPGGMFFKPRFYPTCERSVASERILYEGESNKEALRGKIRDVLYHLSSLLYFVPTAWMKGIMPCLAQAIKSPVAVANHPHGLAHANLANLALESRNVRSFLLQSSVTAGDDPGHTVCNHHRRGRGRDEA
jgi:hypothetical protein